MSLTENSVLLTAEIQYAIDQVCSSTYEQMFEKAARETSASLSPEESQILSTLPNQLNWYNGQQRSVLIERFRRAHLEWFDRWLNEYTTGRPPYSEWTTNMENIMLHLSNLFFRIDLGDAITSEETRQGFRRLADTTKRLLSAINQANPVTIDPVALPVVRELLLILFYFTLDSDLAVYLKNMHLVDLMNDLLRTSDNDDEIHLQTYRILAVIMAEEDIKKLQNSSRIATVFITFIDTSMKDGLRSEGRLFNTLRSLKVLMQHDQIREELIKQKYYTPLLRCVLEERFNPIRAKLPALEILLALTFNKEFLALLRENTEFMTYIRKLTSASEADLQRVATALIWKLEKEVEKPPVMAKEEIAPPPSTGTKKQYDIMISYCHQDKDLCHRISSALEKDNCRIWIDSQLMHGATFDAMANAIENSEFVFICMSDAYKQSPFCQMEASYAVKRRCSIVPLVMTPNYRADGWLGILTSMLIHVDFPKLGFDRAFEEVKKQLQLYRKKTALPFGEKHNPPSSEHSLVSHTIPPAKIKEPRPAVKYPSCIDQWSADQIKSFLLDKDLDALLPALEGMNGQLVHRAYKMCQANQQGMYLSLKEDVGRSHQVTLTLKDYLIFLDSIKVYIPYSATDSSVTSAVCSLS